jgi:alkanesulfonate monooxygenase SsuD/methylene tetrahydromethanopterin reductase-like flavin-dependent oxidoreductase (luciferase family)
MQIGLFDHVEHGDRPLAKLFDERLQFVEAAEGAGFYCLHVAEHHATPLNMVPVPVSISVQLRAPSRACGSDRWSICCRFIRRCG